MVGTKYTLLSWCLSAGVAIGRGKETFEERIRANEQSNSWPNQLFVGRDRCCEHYKELDFIEVADGRVSRMHCAVLKNKSGVSTDPVLEDCSSNGTFLNDRRLGTGKSVVLSDNDKISLVMSVAPMAEQYFIYHKGSPQEQDFVRFYRKRAEQEEEESRGEKYRRSLSKSPTTKYTTTLTCTLEDFKCQICLCTLASCVAIEPCGHNFCASCLSNYLARQLECGAQITCPIRCPHPERIVKNDTVRDLIEKKKRELGRTELTANIEDMESLIDDEFSSPMSHMCPLFDDLLPLDARMLRSRQIELALERLRAGDVNVYEKNQCLEVLARLCWSDDASRKRVTDAAGIDIIKSTMEGTMENEAIQCNGCLALMAMVRGNGNVCQYNQWEIGRTGTVEVVGRAMRKFVSNSMVQLSAMLCFIPLALDNPMMQAHLTQTVLSDILHALDHHQQEADVQCKGLIVLGILAQGEDGLHDAIRGRQMEAGMTKRIIAALERYGSSNEEVFWGVLFALATLVREDSPRFGTICKSLCQSGVLVLLMRVLKSYEERMRADNRAADETIVAAGHYLISAFSDSRQKIRREWETWILCGLGLSLLVGSYCIFTARRRS